MRVLFYLCLFIAVTAPGDTLRAAEANHLPSVMSLNLCADAYLMGFAEAQQILALTPQARDAELSAFHEKAKAFPTSDGQIESIIALAPDLVIVSSYSDPMRNRLIQQLGIKVLQLDAANSYAAARDDIIKLGDAIGRPDAARAYLDTLDAMLAAIQPVAHAPRLLPLQRRNLTVGKGHVMDEVIARAGGVNLGRQNGDGLMSRISLEAVLTSDTDYVVVNEISAEQGGEQGGAANSRGMEFLSHPALTARFGAQQILHIDNNLLVCAGATTPRAVAALVEQLSD